MWVKKQHCSVYETGLLTSWPFFFLIFFYSSNVVTCYVSLYFCSCSWVSFQFSSHCSAKQILYQSGLKSSHIISSIGLFIIVNSQTTVSHWQIHFLADSAVLSNPITLENVNFLWIAIFVWNWMKWKVLHFAHLPLHKIVKMKWAANLHTTLTNPQPTFYAYTPLNQ